MSRGILLRGGKQAEVVAQADPAGAMAGRQVLIRTHAVGLCGSDVSLYLGTYEGPRNYPLFFGHEWSGTVEAVGPEVTKVQPGDKVTGDCSIYCGECEFCPRDQNLCQRIEKFGITIDGASRQLFLQDERYVYRADPRADLDLVALSEPLAVGAHAVRRVAESLPPSWELRRSKVLIFGGGAIGLSCLFALKYGHGCEHVELFDVVESRVKKAIDLGAHPPADLVAAGSGSAGAAGRDEGGHKGRPYDGRDEGGPDDGHDEGGHKGRPDDGRDEGGPYDGRDKGRPYDGRDQGGHKGRPYEGLYSGVGYDLIFETTGVPAVFRQAVDLVRPLGTIMALGFIPSVEFSLKQITFKAARIMGSMGGSGDFEQALAFSLAHPDAARQLISHHVPFEEYRRAFDLAQDRRTAMKVLIHF